MQGTNLMDYEKLRARRRDVSRFGTLCGVFAMLVFISGCPTADTGGGGPPTPECDADTPCADDGDFCNGAESCNADGDCESAGDPCDTDAGEICNEDTDSCDTCGQEGQDECNDDDACTDDACVDGQCAFTATEVAAACDDGDACTGEETCDAATGECVDGDALVCDDGVACTADDCDPATGCTTTDSCPDGETCNLETGVCEAVAAENTDLETEANADIDFTALEVGDTVTIVAPPPPTMTRQVPAGCTCAWSVDPATAGTFDPDDECETEFTLEEAGDFTITVVVTCDDVDTTFAQDGNAAEPAGPQVSITGCPDADVNAGTELSLSASLTDFTADGVPTFAWSADPDTGSFDDTTTQSVTYTVDGTTTVIVSVQDRELVTQATDPVPTDPAVACTAETVGDDCQAGEVCIDDVCNTPGTEEVFVDVGDPVTGECDVNVEFTAELLVDAGGLNAARAALGAIASGVPGAAGNNALNGSANQQGTDADAIATAWTVDSQPDGTGAVTFSNGSKLETAWNIGAPASAGTYVFRLTATNENTSESAFDTTSLVLLDAPQLRLAAAAVARRNVAGTIVTYPVEYNVTDATTFTIWSKETASTAGGTANQFNLGTIAATGTGGTWIAVDFDLDTDLLPAGAGTYLLGWSATDSVGLIPAGGTANQLLKANADEPVAGRRGAALVLGQAKTIGTLSAVTTGAAAATPAEPVGLTLATEVGLPVSVGTGNAAQAFGAGTVIYPGIGDTASAGIAHTAGTMILGNDYNGDGLTDVAYASGANIEVLYGACDLLSDNAGGATALIGQGVAAGAAAAVAATANQDWGPAGAFAANERTRLAITNGTLVDLTVGDFNNDGNLDFGFIGDGAGATGDCGFAFLAGNATGDPMTNAVQLVYTSAGAASETGGGVDAGDFDGDNITDLACGIPGDDTGAADQGVVAVIYGQAMTGTTLNSGFAATGTIAALAAANKFLYSGQGASDLPGGGVILADVTGASSADLVFEQRLIAAGVATGIIGVVAGSNNADQPDTTNATFGLGDPTAGDFAGASIGAAMLTGAVRADLVVAASAFELGAADGALYVIPSASLATGAINGLANTWVVNNNRTLGGETGFGVTAAVLDYDGDGNDDIAVSHNNGTNNTVYVSFGPVAGTGLNFSDTQNGFDFRLEATTAVTQIASGDVNGDNQGDLCLFGAGTGVVVTGLE